MTSFPFDSEFDSDDALSASAAFDAARLRAAAFDAVFFDVSASDAKASAASGFDSTAFDVAAFDAASASASASATADDCEPYARLLTALFDGEASERDAAVARAHLERCARCTQEWLSWTQTRVLLQSVPPPRVPSGLLTRILLFCRLSMLRQAASSAPNRPFETRDTSPALKSLGSAIPVSLSDASNNAPRIALEEAPSASAMLNAMPNIDAPPAHLHQEILNRTTGATNRRRPVDAGIDAIDASSSHRESKRKAAHEYSWDGGSRSSREMAALATRSTRALHRMAPLAVPALLLWIAFSTQEPQTTSTVATESETEHAVLRAAPRSDLAASRSLNAASRPRASASIASGSIAKANAGFGKKDARTHDVATLRTAAAPAIPATLAEPNRVSPSAATISSQADVEVGSSSAAIDNHLQAAPPIAAVPFRGSARLVTTPQSAPRGANAIAATQTPVARTPVAKANVQMATLRTTSTVGTASGRAMLRSGARLKPQLALAHWKSSSRLGPALSALPLARPSQDLNLLNVSTHAISERAQMPSWRPSARPAPASASYDDDEGADDTRRDKDSDPQTLSDMMTEYSAALLDDGDASLNPNAS